MQPQALATTFAAALTALASGAAAQDLATADRIEAVIGGNTVQGSMVESGVYTEFYAEDGTIRGDGYTGMWSTDGDAMCFDYGEGADCWGVRIDGSMVTWVQDGEDLGTGTIVPGNPNDF